MKDKVSSKYPTEIVDVYVGETVLQLEQLANVQAQVQAAILSDKVDAPYWGVVWPSAMVTAYAIGLLGGLKGKRVLELGGGVGALAFAAASEGAEEVISTDIVEDAAEFVRRNAERNGLDVSAMTMDWNNPPADLGKFDGIVAADVLYGDGMLRGVLRFVAKHLNPDGLAIIADPNRVMEGGIEGAAKLHGLEVETTAVPVDLIRSVGLSMFRGVSLYQLKRGRR